MAGLMVAFGKNTFDGSDHEYLAGLSELRVPDSHAPKPIVKVGLQSITALHNGISVADQVVGIAGTYALNCFWDGKFSDIGNTVKEASWNVCSRPAVQMFSVMANISERALQNAAEVSHETDTLCLGITVLTDIGSDRCTSIYGKGRIEKVIDFARDALNCGLGGIVCSGNELFALQNLGLDKRLITVIPSVYSVRLPPIQGDDQKNRMTVYGAMRAGARYLVPGRQIMQYRNAQGHLDPLAATRIFIEEMASV